MDCLKYGLDRLSPTVSEIVRAHLPLAAIPMVLLKAPSGLTQDLPDSVLLNQVTRSDDIDFLLLGDSNVRSCLTNQLHKIALGKDGIGIEIIGKDYDHYSQCSHIIVNQASIVKGWPKMSVPRVEQIEIRIHPRSINHFDVILAFVTKVIEKTLSLGPNCRFCLSFHADGIYHTHLKQFEGLKTSRQFLRIDILDISFCSKIPPESLVRVLSFPALSRLSELKASQLLLSSEPNHLQLTKYIAHWMEKSSFASIDLSRNEIPVSLLGQLLASLNQPTLNTLILDEINLVLVFESLIELLSPRKRFRNLSIRRIGVSSHELFQFLQTLVLHEIQIDKLDISGNIILESELIHFGALLSQIRVTSFCYNSTDHTNRLLDSSAAYLLSSLTRNKWIRTIMMNEHSFGPRSLLQLIRVFEGETRLRFISAQRNDLTKSDISLLLESSRQRIVSFEIILDLRLNQITEKWPDKDRLLENSFTKNNVMVLC